MKLLYTLNKIILLVSVILTSSHGFSQGATCAQMQPICTQVGANFPASTNTASEAGNNYGCLGSQPNPAWYYLEIATNGNINMNLTAGSDIDYIIWGPFANLAAAQANCGSLGPNVSCSYSATNNEFPNINGAVAGQVYIMLITNFANVNQNITLTQIGGTGSTDCSIVTPCALNNFTANISGCNPANSTYGVTGTINYTNPPSSGQLIVEDCDGNQVVVANAPFAANASQQGAYNYNLGGLTADGNACNVHVYFTAEPNCDETINYTAPNPCNPCSISAITRNPGNCVAGNTYTVTGQVTYVNPPTSGTMTVTSSCGGTQVFNFPFPASPISYSIAGLPANGAVCNVTAAFSATPCTLSGAYTAPGVPNANAGAAPTLNCTVTSTNLNGSSSTGGATFNWAGPGITSGGATASPTINAGGTYTVTVTNPANNCTNTATVVVSQNITPPNANAGAAQVLTCANTTRVLAGSSSTGGVTFSWTGPGIVSGGTTATPTVNQPGTYTLTVTNPANGCTATSTVNVTQNITPPNANAGTPQVLTCANPTRVLTGSSSTGGATFSWAGPGIVAGGATATPTVNQVGTYTLTVTNPVNGCTATSTVNVTQNVTPPNANAGTTQILNCTVTSVVLNGSSATGGATFSWTGPGIVSGGTTATPTVNQPGNYIQTVTDPSNGCTATANVNITQNITPPNANAGTAQILNCTVTSVVLNGSSSTGGVTFAWAGPGIVSGGNTATPTVNQPGTYTQTVTNPVNGCTATSTVNVTQNITPPNANAGAPQVLSCAVTSINLNGSSATAGATFSWAGPGIVSGGSTASPTVNQAGTYVLTVTNPVNGCTQIANTTVTNDLALPNANAGTSQTLNCAILSVVLNGSSSTAGVNFSWAGPGIVSGGTTATPTINQPGAYTMTVTDPSNGCVSTSNVNIAQNITPPNANAGSTQILTCNTTSVVLNGSSPTGGVTFSWAGPSIVSGGNTATPTVNQPGTYTLTVTNPINSCTSTATVNITQNIVAPNANAGTPHILNCTVTSVVLNGSSSTPGATFAWAGPGVVSGGNTATPTVNQPGTYTQTVTDPVNGCTATSSVNVTQNITAPNANAGAAQILTCAVTSINLNGSSSTAGGTFSWTGPGIVSGGNTASPIVDQTGTYILTVTDPVNGCTTTASTNVTNNLAVPNANAGPTSILNCSVTSVVLGGSSPTAGVTYSWSGPGIVSGGTSATPTIDQPGSYILTVTNPTNGCTSTANVSITQDTITPNANAGLPLEINCTNPSVVINGSSSTAGVIYSWTGPGIVSGASAAMPTVNQPGVYTMTVTNPVNGCVNSSSVAITQNVAVPLNSFVADSLYGCGSIPVNFQETNGQVGMIYDWNFGNGNTSSAGSSVSEFFDQVGCYNISLTVTDSSNGCSNSVIYPSLICVIAQPNAAFSTYPTQLESVDGYLTTTNGSTNATEYQWNFGDGSPINNLTEPTHSYADNVGLFTVQLVASNQGLCFDTAYVQIDVIESLVLYVPNAFTPDGDNYNEFFKPVFYSGFDPYDFTMYIFNRWGEIVWESHNYDVGWNGTYNGSIVSDGVYSWKIEVKTNATDERKAYTGHVSILR